MLERVDFYVLDQSSQTSKQNYACRIAQKAYQKGMKVLLTTDDEAANADLDKLLWTFSQHSFIPHKISGSEQQNWEHYPVQISHQNLSPEKHHLLIVLAKHVPENCHSFSRIVDLVCNEEKDKIQGRARFRFYNDQGFTPNTHKINNL